MGGLLEQSGEVAGAEADVACNRIQRDVLITVIADVGAGDVDLLQSLVGHRADLLVDLLAQLHEHLIETDDLLHGREERFAVLDVVDVIHIYAQIL